MGVVKTHPYTGDGVPDHRGDDRCTTCGLPQQRDIHELPPQTAEQVAVDARRIGEGER